MRLSSRFRALSVVPSLVLLGAAFAACSSSSSGSSSLQNDAGTPDGASPDGSSGALAVSPTKANVLTCDALQFKETGGAGNGTWAVAPSVGTISSSGLYTAPTASPAVPAASITYTESPQSASASIQVATAFVGTPTSLSIGTNANLDNVPFDHQFSSAGSQIYAAILSSDGLHANVFGSSDSGATFGASTTYHTGDVSCVSVAADAGNPNIVYLVYEAGHGDSTSNTGATVRLAVSSDGAKTFPTEYVVADSDNSIANMICPDVVSPSAGHVLVLGAVFQYGDSNTPAHVGAFASGSNGSSIGPVGTPLTCYNGCAGPTYYAPSDTNTGAAQSTYPIAVDGDGYAPHASSNGKGGVCMVFQYVAAGSNPNPNEVQCSTDSGATWTAPVNVGSPTADPKIHPTIAVSPSGNVAVAWIDTVATVVQSFVAISKDGGKTFGTPIQYPQLATANLGVVDPVVAWESDSILWISETANIANASNIFVDKTCDFGMTWSGAVQVAALNGTSLMMTSKGMVVGGFNTQTPSLSAILLNAQP